MIKSYDNVFVPSTLVVCRGRLTSDYSCLVFFSQDLGWKRNGSCLLAHFPSVAAFQHLKVHWRQITEEEHKATSGKRGIFWLLRANAKSSRYTMDILAR